MFGNASNLTPELSQAINEVSARNDNIDTLSNNAATCNLKIYQVVRFKKMGDNNSTWYESEVLNRARKATAKYKNCFNICLKSPPDIAGETGYIDRCEGDHQSEERVESVTSEGVVMYNLEKSAIWISMPKLKALELDNWNRHVFEEVPDYGQKALTTHWVCTSNTVGSKKLLETNLVARGFEEQNLTEIERDLPIAPMKA